MHKNIKATVIDIVPLTSDSAEIICMPETTIDYTPGQFLMMEIETPREDETWQLCSPEKIYNTILRNNLQSLEDISSVYPYVELKTLEKYISYLEKKQYITFDENTITPLVEELIVKKIPLKRAYSIGSFPGNSLISTIVKETPNGFMSHYLLNRLQKGDHVLLTGPAGRFTFNEKKHNNILLVAAGSGITPLLSMLRYIKERRLPVMATFLYSNKTPEDIIARQELDSLSKEDNLQVIHTITRPKTTGSAWVGNTGRIDSSMIKSIKDYASKDAFICGPLAFSTSMKELLLECGVPQSKINLEAYG